jgi:hypothetical protein
VRRDRLEVQLDAPTLATLDETTRAELQDRVAALAAGLALPLPVTLAPYARGSAFVHPATARVG